MMKKNTEQGFTLLEVIFAISILTIGILAVASMQISAIRGNAFAGGTSEATTWAVDRIEKLMDLPYDHPDLAVSGNPHQDTQGDYSIVWNVTDDAIIDEIKTVTVTVNWLDHGVPKNVRMSFTLGEVV